MPTISGSAENVEVEPAIGRIVPAAIMLRSFSWSRTPSVRDGKFNPVARLKAEDPRVRVTDADKRKVAEQHWSWHDAFVLGLDPRREAEE